MNPQKSKKYKVAYDRFLDEQFSGIDAELFVKVGEWNVCSIEQDPL